MERYGFPQIDDFINIEKQTFDHLKNATALSCHRALHTSLSQMYTAIKNKKTNPIQFYGYFDSVIESIQRRVHLGGLVRHQKKKLDEVSYFIAICDNTSDRNSEVLLKVHFDTAIPGQTGKASQPLYHFQVGGKLHPEMQESHTYGIAWLSVPRIPFFPLSTALFLDFVFSELGDKPLKDMINENTWRKIIKVNEKNIIKPFLKQVASRIDGSTTSVRDMFYES